jgi:hypothetical protein
MASTKTYIAWGTCIDCGYEGMLEYSRVSGEDYADAEALGVVLMLHCPACENSEHTLVALDYYQELIAGDAEPADGE